MLTNREIYERGLLDRALSLPPIAEPSLPVEIHQLEGDDTVLCAIVLCPGRAVAVVNSRYPWAEAHVRRHVTCGFDKVLVCTPECNDAQ